MADDTITDAKVFIDQFTWKKTRGSPHLGNPGAYPRDPAAVVHRVGQVAYWSGPRELAEQWVLSDKREFGLSA